MEEAYVTLKNGETIFYRKRPGGDKAVLLIHGNMSSSNHWKRLMRVFDERFTVFAPDLRGFGLSTYNETITSLKDFSDDIKLFVDEIGLRKFSVIGWSLGGGVAMRFTLDYPQHVEKLVLLASISTRGYPIFSMNEDGTFNVKKRLKTMDEIASDYRTKWMEKLYESNDRQMLKKLLDSLIFSVNRPPEEMYEEAIDDMLKQRNLVEANHAINIFNISDKFNGTFHGTDETKNINVPVLNIYGVYDRTVTKRMIDEIAADLAHCVTTVKLKNCGHAPDVDDLPTLKQEIETFLDRG